MGNSNFEKYCSSSAGSNFKPDLRSEAQKACDYIRQIASLANATNEKFVQNALRNVNAFPDDYPIIHEQIFMAEQMLRKRINQGGNARLPGREVFRNGIINTGRIVGADIDARLTIEQFSGNMAIYGQYGMGKTNFNLSIIPQLAAYVHIDIFDTGIDYRDLLQMPECAGGLVFDTETDRLNPLEPVGSPEEHLQFLWEITKQDFNLRDETKEMLFNYSNQLYRRFGVYEGKKPPTLFDLKEYLKDEREKKGTSPSNKNKIRTALEKLTYMLSSFGKIADCNIGYSLDFLDRFPLTIYEMGNLSEDKRSWYIKLKLKQYYHKGLLGKDRHKAKRIVVIDEAKGILAKSRIGESTNYIKDMFTHSRAIGVWWVISDQFATELADFVRAASCQICFQHSIPKEIREITSGMGADDSVRQEIPRLGKFRMFQKITDFPYSYMVMTPRSGIRRHICDNELRQIMKGRLLKQGAIGGKADGKVRMIASKKAKTDIIQDCGVQEKAVVKVVSSAMANPLSDMERFLRYAKDNPEANLTEIYRGLKFSGRKGDSIKTSAKENGLIMEKTVRSDRKGRPSIELELTEKGREYINEKRFP